MSYLVNQSSTTNKYIAKKTNKYYNTKIFYDIFYNI